MKKVLVSALAALAMVVGGVAPVAHAAPMAAPATLDIASSSNGQFSLTWSAVSGATYYEVYTTTSINNWAASWTRQGSPTASTSAIISGLMAGASYNVKILALSGGVGTVGGNPESWFSTTNTYSPNGSLSSVSAPGYLTPAGLSVAASSQNPQVTLSFTGQVGPGDYVYSYSTDYDPNGAAHNGTWSTPGTWNPGQTASASQSVLFNNLPAGSYYFRVQKMTGNIAYTTQAFAYTPPVNSPNTFSATPITGQYTGIALTFVGQAGSGTYTYGYSSNYDPSGAAGNGTWNDSTYAAAANASATQTLNFMQVPAGTYYFRAKKDSGAFGYSTASFTYTIAQQGPPPSSSVSIPILPTVPVFKQPKFEMPSKIDVDVTGKVKLSGKDMGVKSVLVGGKEQKIDSNSDTALEFDTTGLAKGVHDLVMKGAFGTYTVQKAIQVGEAVVTKVAAVSARQVGMAGGELSISGQGLEGTTQITMNGQVLEIVSKTDSKVTFKVPASTVASVNSIMIEGSFVPVIFKNAFSYTK